MYYIIYKITNLINEKIYVGCHKTKKLNDSYMGSGTIIERTRIISFSKASFCFNEENIDIIINKFI